MNYNHIWSTCRHVFSLINNKQQTAKKKKRFRNTLRIINMVVTQVIVPKLKGEMLGIVIVESGWGSMVPTVVLANMYPSGPAARCGQLNIGDQIISINGISLVGLPLSACQNYIKVSTFLNLARMHSLINIFHHIDNWFTLFIIFTGTCIHIDLMVVSSTSVSLYFDCCIKEWKNRL